MLLVAAPEVVRSVGEEDPVKDGSGRWRASAGAGSGGNRADAIIPAEVPHGLHSVLGLSLLRHGVRNQDVQHGVECAGSRSSRIR